MSEAILIKKAEDLFNKSISGFAPMELNLVQAVWHATEGKPERVTSLSPGIQIAVNNLYHSKG